MALDKRSANDYLISKRKKKKTNLVGIRCCLTEYVKRICSILTIESETSALDENETCGPVHLNCFSSTFQRTNSVFLSQQISISQISAKRTVRIEVCMPLYFPFN
jgi:hypothetical protein